MNMEFSLPFVVESFRVLLLHLSYKNKLMKIAIIQGYVSPVPWKCSEEFFSHQIKKKDPLKIG